MGATITRATPERTVLVKIDVAAHGEHGGLALPELVRRTEMAAGDLLPVLYGLQRAGLVDASDRGIGPRTYWPTPLGHAVVQAPRLAGAR